MKKLILILFLLSSCEKDQPKDPPQQPQCYQCQTLWETTLPPQNQYFCDRSSMGFTPAGNIAPDDVKQYEAQHTRIGLFATKCWKQ